MAESIQQLILHSLDLHGAISDTRQLTLPTSTAPATDAESQITILGALNSLLSREVFDLLIFPVITRFRAFLQMIHYESREILSHVLTPEGAQIALHGSHEARVWAALPTRGADTPLLPADLKKKVGDESAKVGQGRAFKNGWIAKHGDGLVKAVCQQQSSPRHTAPLMFRSPDS